MASSIPSGGFGLPLNTFGHSHSLHNPRQRKARSLRARSTSGAAGTSAPKGVLGNFPLKASLIAGGLALTGDTIAQTLGKYQRRKKSLKPGEKDDVLSWLLAPHDFVRSLRMLTYGALLYGPGSDWWYKLLDRHLPGMSPFNLVSKIILNQVSLRFSK
jgi:protein Mpv17